MFKNCCYINYMRTPTEFIDEHWHEIEQLSISLDDLIEEMRRHEAHSKASQEILFPHHKDRRRAEMLYRELERVLRAAKQNDLEAFNVKTLTKPGQIEWLRAQVSQKVDSLWVIQHLLEKTTDAIADSFMTNFSEEELRDVDCSTLQNIAYDDEDRESERRFIVSLIAEEREKTGYEAPGQELSEQATKLSIKISGRISELLPVKD